MTKAVSCGGVVIHRGKVLVLYKKHHKRFDAWVLPKGTVEKGETFEETALREVKEETGVKAEILGYIGNTNYKFKGYEGTVSKTVHWFLMSADSFYSKPQKEEFFADSGFYKQHEAYHLLKFNDEKQIMSKAFKKYYDNRSNNPENKPYEKNKSKVNMRRKRDEKII